jgi:N utilization substance protein B
MPSRQQSRQRALQMLYLWDMRKQPMESTLQEFYTSLAEEEEKPTPPDRFAEQLVHGAVVHTNDIDRRILEHSEHWRLERMPVVDIRILPTRW